MNDENKMNFSNTFYKNIALNTKFDESKVHSPEEAFFILIHDVDSSVIDNFVNQISKEFNISFDEAYALTQNLNLKNELKKEIFSIALECILEMPLGNKTINDGKINLSDWLGHSLNVSIVCKKLAEQLKINSDVAQSMGLLHDYGRKYIHTFNHTMVGCEKLFDMGWVMEGIGCLTHSYISNGRCANNEVAIEGFSVDDNGNVVFVNDLGKDDMVEFLDKYQYSQYDLLLNMADLMATGTKIMSPYDRIKDIATRRKIDLTNRKYFFAETLNLFVSYLNSTANTNRIPNYKAKFSVSLEELENELINVSNEFYDFYNKNCSKKI